MKKGERSLAEAGNPDGEVVAAFAALEGPDPLLLARILLVAKGTWSRRERERAQRARSLACSPANRQLEPFWRRSRKWRGWISHIKWRRREEKRSLERRRGTESTRRP